MRIIQSVLNKSLFLFTIFLFTIECFTSQALVTSLTKYSCENISYSMDGVYILKNIQGSVSQMTISGWFNLKGNTKQDYMIVGIKQQEKDYLFVSYSSDKTITVKAYWFYQSSIDLNSLWAKGLQDNWFYIRAGSYLKDGMNHYLYFYMEVLDNSGNILKYSKQHSYIDFLSSYDKNSFQLFYGDYAIKNYNKLCGYIKKVKFHSYCFLFYKFFCKQQLQVYINLGNKSSNGPNQAISNQEKFLYAELIFKINFSLLPSKPKQFINTVENYIHQVGINQQVIVQTSKYQILGCDDSIKTRSFNFKRRDGIYVAFDIKITGDLVNFDQKIFALYFDDLSQQSQILYSIDLSTDSISYFIKDSFLGVQDTQSITLNSGQWYRFQLLFQISFNSIFKELYINNSMKISNTYPQNKEIGMVNLQFINQPSTVCFPVSPPLSLGREIYLKEIKIYEGNYFENSNQCQIQMKEDENDCNLCISSLLIQGEYSSCSSLGCPQNYQDLESTSICEWDNLSICPIEGQYKFFNQICSCPTGYFLNSSTKCEQCPELCITCTSADLCSQYYSPRDSLGICSKGQFDDGKKCIQDFMKIPNRQNKKLSPKKPQINCFNPTDPISDFMIKDKAFEIGIGSQGFFVSFSINFTPDGSISKSYTLGYMNDEDNKTIFSMVFEEVNIGLLGIHTVQLLVSFISKSNMFNIPFQKGINTWIGLYTDLINVILIIKSKNAPVAYYKYSFSKMPIQQIKDPSLFIGGVKTPNRYTNHPFCGTIIGNYWVLGGHSSMFDFQEILSQQESEDMKNLVDFNFSLYEKDYILQSQNIVNKKNFLAVLYQKQINYQFDQIKGLDFTMQDASYIKLLQITSFNLGIQLIFTPKHIPNLENYGILKIQYNSNIAIITFTLLKSTFELQKYADLQICVLSNCEMLKYIKIEYDQPNHIQKYNDQFEIIKFDIISNYKYEEVNIIEGISSYFDTTKLSLTIGQVYSSQNDHVFYLNNFYLYQGGFFYIDYDLSDPCFLYINRENMVCIIPKKGYSIRDSEVVVDILCNYGRKIDQTILFYNPYTQKCQDSGTIIAGCAEIKYINTQVCYRCTNPYLKPEEDCRCNDGMFFNLKLLQCTPCSPICKSCDLNKDNCIECAYFDASPPFCQCPYYNQYYDENITCQFCEPQCEQCEGYANMCTVCKDGRVLAPVCRCDPKYYINKDSDNLSIDCIKIQCNHKCLTCTYSQDNCEYCRGDRINAPECGCEKGKFEHPTIKKDDCSTCSSYEYFDKTLQSCQLCYTDCRTCYGPDSSNCNSCYGDFILMDDNSCKCASGSESIASTIGENQCYSFMNAIIYSDLINYEYFVIVEFEQEIDYIEEMIQTNGINSLVEITISQVPPQYYYIKRYQVNKKNQLTVYLGVNHSFRADYAYFIFKNTSKFKNTLWKFVLDPIYKQKPFQFKIGPYMMVLGDNEGTVDLLRGLQPSNQTMIKFIRNLQFLFYFINSIQPTAMFLLIKTNIPLNFYTFLSIFGTLVYKDMPEYQNDKLNDGYTLIGKSVDSSLSISGQLQFDRLGFRSSFLVNCEIIIYKYIIFIILAILSSVLIQMKPSYKNQLISQQQLQSIQAFFIKKICEENEVNLLIGIISLCIQFNNFQQDNYLDRWGLYLASFIIIILISSFIWSFSLYNSLKLKSEQNILSLFFNRLDLDKTQNNWIVKNYHFISHLRKIIILLLIYFLLDSPLTVCLVCGFLSAVSALQCFYYKPYKYFLTSILKGIADLLQFSTWIYMIIFYKFNVDHENDISLNEDEVQSFLSSGFQVSIILLAYNILFFIIFFYENVLIVLYNMIRHLISKDETVQLQIKKKQGKTDSEYSESRNTEIQITEIQFPLKVKQLNVQNQVLI